MSGTISMEELQARQKANFMQQIPNGGAIGGTTLEEFNKLSQAGQLQAQGCQLSIMERLDKIESALRDLKRILG